ncbi:hypothetical protein GGF41_000901 [Coemansia sp. RSA 2531]|nr:hypothetical protein GGF41_000901 [Coemansia sp. RSA 2531]
MLKWALEIDKPYVAIVWVHRTDKTKSFVEDQLNGKDEMIRFCTVDNDHSSYAQYNDEMVAFYEKISENNVEKDLLRGQVAYVRFSKTA